MCDRKILCEDCGGSGYAHSMTYPEYGPDACYNCNGTGYQVCSFCNGSGRDFDTHIYYTRQCFQCNGSGYEEYVLRIIT